MKTLTRKMLRVARMEFLLTAANRAFVIITILGPFIIVAMSVLPSLVVMGEDSEGKSIALVGGPQELTVAVSQALEQARMDVEVVETLTESIENRAESGELDGYVVLPDDPYGVDTFQFSTSRPSQWQLISTVESVMGASVVRFRLQNAGLEQSRINQLLSEPSLRVRPIVEEDQDGDQGGETDFMNALFVGLAFTFMLYMTILLYGQTIGRSVIMEKTNKTVEIMLSSVTQRDLLFGKIFGKAGAGLLQYGIWIGMAVLMLQVVGPAFDLSIEIAGGARTWVNLVGFFLLAFFMYSAIYAALGAASEDEQHLGQLAWPVILFLVVPMVLIGALTSNPDGTMAQVLSIFPLTAPIVMFQRTLLGNPQVWELALSLVLMVGTIVGIGLMSAKIFRVGILMTGKRFKLSEVVRWIRY